MTGCAIWNIVSSIKHTALNTYNYIVLYQVIYRLYRAQRNYQVDWVCYNSDITHLPEAISRRRFIQFRIRLKSNRDKSKYRHAILLFICWLHMHTFAAKVLLTEPRMAQFNVICKASIYTLHNKSEKWDLTILWIYATHPVFLHDDCIIYVIPFRWVCNVFFPNNRC